MKFTLLIAIFALFFLLSSCALVPQMEREYLSDPQLQLDNGGHEKKLEGENFPRREGSTGGGSGAGGGCGC
jgi:hypothetical protein